MYLVLVFSCHFCGKQIVTQLDPIPMPKACAIECDCHAVSVARVLTA